MEELGARTGGEAEGRNGCSETDPVNSRFRAFMFACLRGVVGREVGNEAEGWVGGG